MTDSPSVQAAICAACAELPGAAGRCASHTDVVRTIAAALRAYDTAPRCQCHLEPGDSPCRVHGEESA